MMTDVAHVFLSSTLFLMSSFTLAACFVVDGQANLPDTLPEGSSTEQLLQVTLAEEKVLRMKLEQEVKRLNATLQGEIAAMKRDVEQLKSAQISALPDLGRYGQLGLIPGPTSKQPSAPASNFYAFEAGISHEVPHLNTNQRLLFDIVRLNIGNAYNPLHGTFTVPVNGTYLFNVVLAAVAANTYVHLVKNGTCQGDAFVDYYITPNGQYWGHFARSFLLHLAVGDGVWLEDYSGTAGTLHAKHLAGHAPLNQFSGFLVRADM